MKSTFYFFAAFGVIISAAAIFFFTGCAGSHAIRHQDPRPPFPYIEEEITFTIHAHPALKDEQRRIRSGKWQDVLGAIMGRKDQIIHISEQIDDELAEIVDQFRNQMNFLASIRQTFSALLNVLPATVAVSYILTTGDPVGAAGIKVKLTGLFGLKDLYALSI